MKGANEVISADEPVKQDELPESLLMPTFSPIQVGRYMQSENPFLVSRQVRNKRGLALPKESATKPTWRKSQGERFVNDMELVRAKVRSDEGRWR